LLSSDQQFGFKANRSTKMCIVVANNGNTITAALLNEILAFLKLILIKNGFFDITGNGAPFYFRYDIKLFISLICTSDI